MRVSILIPHYKNGKVTAYAISQLLKFKGKHEIEIFVIDNHPDDSVNYLYPFRGQVQYIQYPKEKLQSHGISFDWAIMQGFISNEYFITIESDSFPTDENWLDYYENIIEQGIDCAGSILQLSGGTYLHPCGSLYKKSIWEEAKKYCDSIEYSYFPNMSRKEGFDCHLMIHNSVLDLVLANLDDYIELAESYKGLSKEEILAKRDYYKPCTGVFHNGMGGNIESIKTYRQRTFNTDVPTLLLDNKKKYIARIGYEPGQYFCYWHFAMNKKVFAIPTETKWLPGRENQQQEYTINEAGFKHIWCGSSYLGMENTQLHDVFEFKSDQIEKLYQSLPREHRV